MAFPTGWPELAAACARGLADLAALQVPATGPDGEELRVPAAGAPWFLTLLGRDALLTSLFALPYRPRLAAATLPALAATQATETGADAVAQPGKIVHEVRHGELAHFGQVPYGRYYGSVDATPLFLVLLGAYTEHTGDTGPRPPPGTPRPGRDRLDARPRRPDLARLPGLPRRPGRPRQPELEGLPRRDLLRRRHPPAAAR